MIYTQTSLCREITLYTLCSTIEGMLAAPILRYVQLGIAVPAHPEWVVSGSDTPQTGECGSDTPERVVSGFAHRFRPVPAGFGWANRRTGEPFRTLPNPSEPRHYLTIGVAGFIGENFGIVRTSKQARLTPVPTMPVERSSLRSNAVRRFPIVDTRQTACAILTTVFDFVVKLTFIGNSLKIV